MSPSTHEEPLALSTSSLSYSYGVGGETTLTSTRRPSKSAGTADEGFPLDSFEHETSAESTREGAVVSRGSMRHLHTREIAF